MASDSTSVEWLLERKPPNGGWNFLGADAGING